MDLESSKCQLMASKIPSCVCARTLGVDSVPCSKYLCCSEGRCPLKGFSGFGMGLGAGERGDSVRNHFMLLLLCRQFLQIAGLESACFTGFA